MVTIFKAMIAMAEDYLGTIETASLHKHEHGKSYTHDSIQIDGVADGGRKFSLELTMEDEQDDT